MGYGDNNFFIYDYGGQRDVVSSLCKVCKDISDNDPRVAAAIEVFETDHDISELLDTMSCGSNSCKLFNSCSA